MRLWKISFDRFFPCNNKVALKHFNSFERPDINLKTLFQEDFIKMLPGMERRLTGMIIQETIDSNSIFNYILAPVCGSSKAWAV